MFADFVEIRSLAAGINLIINRIQVMSIFRDNPTRFSVDRVTGGTHQYQFTDEAACTRAYNLIRDGNDDTTTET